jgi:hypothetical protein
MSDVSNGVPSIEYLLNDYTIILSVNDDKFRQIKKLSEWCITEGIQHVTYNLNNEIFDIEYWLKNATTEEIVRATRMIINVSSDFEKDVENFEAHYKVKLKTKAQLLECIGIVKTILRLTGSGYQKLFIIFLKAIQSKNASYYFLYLPETSLHQMLAEKVLDLLLGNFKYMRIIFATNLERIAECVPYGYDASFHKGKVIRL